MEMKKFDALTWRFLIKFNQNKQKNRFWYMMVKSLEFNN